MPLIALPIIGAVGAIAGGAIAAHGATSAAKTQAQSATDANAVQKQEFDQQQQNLAPYRQTGTAALSKLNALPDFQAPTADQAAATPGYQFQFDQGEKALNNSLIAQGMQGGNGAEALLKYGQGLASTNYQNTFADALTQYNTNSGRLATLANMGLGATNSTNQASQNYANQAGQNITGAGNAIAAGDVASSNAWNGALSGLSNSLETPIILKSLGSSMYGQKPPNQATSTTNGYWDPTNAG